MLKALISCILLFAIIVLIWIMFDGFSEYYKARDEYRRKTGKYYYNGDD